MHLHAKPRELITMQPPRRIIPNLPHIPRLQSPHRASRHRRRHLSPRQHVRRPKRHLRPPFRILRHRNNRVRSIQPHPNQIHSRPLIHPTHSSFSASSANSVVNPLHSQTESQASPYPVTTNPKNAVIPSEARNLLFDAASLFLYVIALLPRPFARPLLPEPR